MKKYDNNNIDSFELYLDESKFPQVYKVKLEELMKNGMTEKEARTFLNNTPFVMELYCDPQSGIFAVESDAVESCAIYNPYSGEEIEENDTPIMNVLHYCVYEDKTQTFDVYELIMGEEVYYVGDNKLNSFIHQSIENDKYKSYCLIDQNKDLLSLKELDEMIYCFYDESEEIRTKEQLIDYVKQF